MKSQDIFLAFQFVEYIKIKYNKISMVNIWETMFRSSMGHAIIHKKSISLFYWFSLTLLMLCLNIVISIIVDFSSGTFHFVNTTINTIIVFYILKRIGCDFGEIWDRYNKKLKSSLLTVFKYSMVFIAITVMMAGLFEIVALFINKLTSGNIEIEKSIGTLITMSSEKNNYFRNIIYHSQLQFILLLISICFLTPIIEEIMYRRLLYVTLRKKMNMIWSLLISACIFGIFHFSGVVLGFFFGLFLGYIYEKEQDILSNIIFHGIKNFVAIIVMVFI